MLKGNHFLLIICLLGLLFVSCKKNANSEKQQPCAGGCGVIDFSLIDYEPAWSPDGKHIAYYHSDKEISKNGIYLITPDGKENRLWHRGAGATPTWSPDGQWVAFSEGAQIWKKKLNGDSLTRITNEGRNFFPSWSPDGKWIAYGQSVCNAVPCGLWLVSIETGKTFFLVNYGNFPTWNLQTKEIIYQTRLVQPGGNVLGDSLWIYNLDSGKKRPLTTLIANHYNNNYFKYSINNQIAFTSKTQNGSNHQIWIMNTDGTGLRQLTKTQGYSADWSPDGNKIVYTDSRSVNGRLWIMNADGSDKRQLTFKENF